MQSTVIKKLLCLTFYSLPLVAFAANFTEPRAQIVPGQKTQTAFLQMEVVIYKSHREQLASFSRLPADPLKLRSGRPTSQELMAFIRNQAMEYGVNPKLALWIVKHESEFNPRAKGDGEASRGLWQISRIYHPEVPDAVAFDAASSTEWSLERIRSGKVNEWSTYRFCRTLYEDCPF